MKTENLLLIGGAGLLAWMYFSKQQQPAASPANAVFQFANSIQPGLGDEISRDLGSMFATPGGSTQRLVGAQAYGQPSAIQASSNPLASSVDYAGGSSIGIPTSVPSDANNSLASADTFRPTPAAPANQPPSAFSSYNGGAPIYVGATINPSPAQAPPVPTSQEYVDYMEGLRSKYGDTGAFEALHRGDIAAFDVLAARNQANESAGAYLTIAGGRDRILASYTPDQIRMVADKYYGGASDVFGAIREGDVSYLSTHS